MSINKTEKAKLIMHDTVAMTPEGGIPYTKHTFLMQILSTNQVTEVTAAKEEYLEALYAKFGVSDMNGFLDYLNNNEVELHFANSKNYIGYSFTEPFAKNNFPNVFGADVEITNVEASPSGILFHLADGTVANRNFSRKVGAGDDAQWLPDPIKQMNFIRDLAGKGLNGDPLTFDLNTLKGYLVTYNIKTIGSGQNANRFFDVIQIKAPVAQTEDPNEAFLKSLEGK